MEIDRGLVSHRVISMVPFTISNTHKQIEEASEYFASGDSESKKKCIRCARLIKNAILDEQKKFSFGSIFSNKSSQLQELLQQANRLLDQCGPALQKIVDEEDERYYKECLARIDRMSKQEQLGPESNSARDSIEFESEISYDPAPTPWFAESGPPDH